MFFIILIYSLSFHAEFTVCMDTMIFIIIKIMIIMFTENDEISLNNLFLNLFRTFCWTFFDQVC